MDFYGIIDVLWEFYVVHCHLFYTSNSKQNLNNSTGYSKNVGEQDKHNNFLNQNKF